MIGLSASTVDTATIALLVGQSPNAPLSLRADTRSSVLLGLRNPMPFNWSIGDDVVIVASYDNVEVVRSDLWLAMCTRCRPKLHPLAWLSTLCRGQLPFHLGVGYNSYSVPFTIHGKFTV